MLQYDLEAGNLDWRDAYRLCIGFINPRPIALVSTVSPDGRHNLAPFSFFNMVSANPPVVIFCPGLSRDGKPKDTLVNVEATGEFVVATVTADIAEPMVRCGAALEYGRSEFEFSGLTPRPARRVKPPLVAEARVNIECCVQHIIRTGAAPGSSSVVFGRIVVIHVDEAILDDDRLVDPHKLPTVGRLGGAWYCNVVNPYRLEIPKV